MMVLINIFVDDISTTIERLINAAWFASWDGNPGIYREAKRARLLAE
jgi:hypothetical protein